MRGTSRSSAISPKKSPAPEPRLLRAVDLDRRGAVGDHEEAVAGIALLEHRRGRRERAARRRSTRAARSRPAAAARRSGSPAAARAARSATRAPASIAVICRHVRSASAGRTTPTTTNVARGPSCEMSSGVIERRRARSSRASRLCRTPKTRPTTFGGAARCSSVMPVTSTSVLPMPMTPKRRSASAKLSDAASSDERDPEDGETEAEVAGEPLARGEHDADEAAEQAADAERGVEPADARVARVQHADRVDDDHHLERTGDEHLRAGQPDRRPAGGGPRAIARKPASSSSPIALRRPCARAACRAAGRARRRPTRGTTRP